MTTQSILTSLVGIPMDCSGRFMGVERLPNALRGAGLADQLGLRGDGDLPVTIDSPERDITTVIIGFQFVCKSPDTIRIEIGKLLNMAGKCFARTPVMRIARSRSRGGRNC